MLFTYCTLTLKNVGLIYIQSSYNENKLTVLWPRAYAYILAEHFNRNDKWIYLDFYPIKDYMSKIYDPGNIENQS